MRSSFIKYGCCPVLLFMITACNNVPATKNSGTPQVQAFTWPDSMLESRIRDTLQKIPFVKRAAKYFDSLSNHKEGVTFTMDTFKGKVFTTAVYYDENRFQKLYRFEIVPAEMKIKIFNADNGEFITLEEHDKLNPADKF